MLQNEPLKSTLIYYRYRMGINCIMFQLQTSVDLYYVSVTNFNRFITNKTKHHGKKHFGNIAYNASIV